MDTNSVFTSNPPNYIEVRSCGNCSRFNWITSRCALYPYADVEIKANKKCSSYEELTAYGDPGDDTLGW